MGIGKWFTRSRLYYLLFLFIFTLIALEIFGRIYLNTILKKSTDPKFRFNSYRIYEHVPGFHEGDGKKDWIVINNQGFRRSTDVSKIKPVNTFRAFLMGASAAHGISTAAPYPLVHIYMDQTIDHYLEENLKKLHPGKNIEIINAAVTGYQVFQHTPYLLSEILDYHPDLVIFFDGANDHYFNNPDFDYWGENRYQYWKSRLQHPSVSGCFNYFTLWLSKYSGFARGYYAWSLNNDAVKHDKKIIDPYKDNASGDVAIANHKQLAKRAFLRAIEANINILQTNQVQTIICLQPMLVLRDTINLSPAEKSFLNKDPNTQLLYPVVVQELNELTSKYRVPFIDMNPAFNDPKYKGQQLLIDYCHLSPSGGEAAANQMLQAVDSLVTK